MHKSSLIGGLLAICVGSVVFADAVAGPYADDMGKCLVRETGAPERAAIMKWLFAAMALHPDVESLSAIDVGSRDSINQGAGALFQRLLVESCRSESKMAIRYEGAVAIQSAFSLLGQVAMQELLSNPKVAAGLAELEKNVDQKLISELSAADSE